MEQQNRELFKSSTELDNFVVESFNASETVKTYTAEKVMENEMQTRFKKFQDKKYQNTLQNEVQNSFVSVISNIGNIFMLGIMGIYVMAGSMTVGELVKAYMYVNYLFQPINYIMGMKKEMIEITSVLERLDDVFNTYTEEEINKNRKNLSDKIRKIEFEKASFKYGMRSNVLNDISFELNEGDSIGIIGTTGCGKTTLIKLILGFYNVTNGILKINDIDIKEYTTLSVRKRIAYVSQNDYWFSDTIFNNLVIGNIKATTEDLDRICNIVKMDEFIKKCPFRI